MQELPNPQVQYLEDSTGTEYDNEGQVVLHVEPNQGLCDICQHLWGDHFITYDKSFTGCESASDLYGCSCEEYMKES